jgi:hypothetical protein
VEATNAWRMRRTRGDMGRFLLLAVALRVVAGRGFLAGIWLVGVLVDFGLEFGGADLVAGFEAGGVWSVDTDFLLEESEAEG